ncbi:MAG: FAD-dependent oxidoreductase [Acidobacteriota bacterium]|nr:FAD-dependent oxidoreductase [Blastocatellia bacterium]MDW8411160.1 FAD-dependent oxidoreductase [Acidobacteriota bacterium]
MDKKRVIIIGGGFAGVKCAKTLCKKLPKKEFEIVLFNRENHMVFQPLLAEVVGASLDAESIAAPLRQMLKGVLCRTEEVQNINLEESYVEFESWDGSTRKMSYDHVVIACGGDVNLGMMPGMADHAFPMRTIGDAIALRAHICQQLERAEVCDDPTKKRWLLSFVVVGGGYSGVEAAGEINDLIRSSHKYYSNIEEEDLSVTLVHSQNQILPEIGPQLREFARKKMQQAGIKILLNSRVKVATAEGVGLTDGREISAATVVCTIGGTMSPVVKRLNANKEKGRLVTDPDMRLPSHKNAWAIGDCAIVPNAYDGKPSPPTGQFAERQGKQCAENIARTIKGKTTKPFYFKPLGQLCSIGGHTAVAELFGIKLSGFLAWFVWRGVYLFKLPTWSKRIKVGLDWAWQLIFPRDLVHLKANTTERVCRAYYQPGDYFFREGDPAMNFYVIETGEVEVVKEHAGKEEVLAVLGAGSFFGEMALINNKPRSASCRARTAVEVTVIGRNVFTQISNSLAPLKKLLADTVKRRSKLLWQNLPAAEEVLAKLSVMDVAEPVPKKLLKTSDTLEQVVALFEAGEEDFFFVSDDGKSLDGIVTLTDVLRALESRTTEVARVGQFCNIPLAVCATDTALIAAQTMRDNGFKWMPIISDKQSRILVGWIKAQTLISKVLHKRVLARGATAG